MFYEEHDLYDFDYALDKAREADSSQDSVAHDFPDRMAEHDAKDEKEYEVFD